MSLFANIFGDFGAAGMPGTFKRFFVDVVVQMARSMHVLTLPMPIYVDDCALIGPCPVEVDAEMVAFHEWAWDVCGVGWPSRPSRTASRPRGSSRWVFGEGWCVALILGLDLGLGLTLSLSLSLSLALALYCGPGPSRALTRPLAYEKVKLPW